MFIWQEEIIRNSDLDSRLGDTFTEGSNEEGKCFLKALANVIWNVLTMKIDGHVWCIISETVFGVQREI